MTTENEPLLLRAARLLEEQAREMTITHAERRLGDHFIVTAAELRAMHERMKDGKT